MTNLSGPEIFFNWVLVLFVSIPAIASAMWLAGALLANMWNRFRR